MLEPETLYLWNQLLAAQAQAALACQNYNGGCPIDTRYQMEWENLRDYLDVMVYNIGADLTAVEEGRAPTYTERENRIIMTRALETSVPTAQWLLAGYVYDLANCADCTYTNCALKQRAQLYLSTQGNA